MSADKRSFTNFKDFPGKIIDGVYEFPTLYKSTDNGKMRQWKILVRLIKESSKKPNETKSINWNIMSEDPIPIKEDYLDDEYPLPDGTIAQYWTENGIIGMKTTISAAKYPESKNIGKKNERNSFHSALIEARAKFLQKQNEGSTEDKNAKDITYEKLYPMSAKNYKDFKNKIKYPIYVQPKLDGLRCIIYLDNVKPPTYKDVIMYSRQRKIYPSNISNDNIRKSLLKLLVNNYNHKTRESIYLDGELYKHRYSLQSINSAVRSSDSKSNIDEYHIFDIFYPSYKNETFEQRYETMRNIYDTLSSDEKKYVRLVPTHYVSTQKECDSLYNKYLEDDYEGIMIRNPAGIYLKSSTKKSEQLRSSDLLKRKEIFTDEFEVVGFACGEGKEYEAVKWILQTPNGDKFTSTPNQPLSERYKIYKECIKNNNQGFDKKYKNRMMTIEYRSFSDDGIPLQAKSIGFRDFK